MKLITSSIDIDELIKNQETVDWENILNNDFTQEEINNLCDNVNNQYFWMEVVKKYKVDVKYIVKNCTAINWRSIFDEYEFSDSEYLYLLDNIDDIRFKRCFRQTDFCLNMDVKNYVKYQDKIFNWRGLLNKRHFVKSEIEYLADNVNNDEFWFAICGFAYIQNVNCEQLIQHQHSVCWQDIFYNRKFVSTEINKLIQQVSDEEFFEQLSQTKYVNLMPIDDLIKYISLGDWVDVLRNHCEFSQDEINYLLNNIKDNLFVEIISDSQYCKYISKEFLVKTQMFVEWERIFNNRDFDEEEIQYLISHVDNASFIYFLSGTKYIKKVDVKYIVKNCRNINWKKIFNNRDFTNFELYYLLEHVDAKYKTLINDVATTRKMSYEELMSNRKNINWATIDIDSLSISENEKKLLLTRIPELSLRFAEDISDDFSKIKEKPIKRFYTIGNKDMHRQRQGAFVIVQDGSQPPDVLIEYDGSHNDMLVSMAYKYGYNQETLMKLMNVEAGMAEISGKMDLDAEAEQELEYAKEHLHCCCGYIHVDKDNNNPIAIMDARRVYNFSPQQVAKLLQGKKYDGKEIIAFGINDPGASAIAFMKVANLKKKRLISHNFRILYFFKDAKNF